MHKFVKIPSVSPVKLKAKRGGEWGDESEFQRICRLENRKPSECMNMRSKRSLAIPGSLSLPLPNDVGAIAVDTNIYKEYGFRIRSQPLIELTRMKDLGVKWVVPEVWEHELLHHFSEATQKVTGLQRELSKVLEWADEEQVQLANKLSITLASETPSTVASKLLGEHFGRAKPIRLPTDWTVGPDVLKRYFDGTAPFEITGHKKSEFPDAFALATLANWATANNTRVLVVTRDAGCARACEAFEVLVATTSLTEALSVLRASDIGRKAVVSEYESLIALELADERSELRVRLDAEIENRLMDLDLEIEYDEESGLECEYEIVNVTIDRIQPIAYADGVAELRVFSASLGELSFSCALSVQLEVGARFARTSRNARTYSYLSDAPEYETNGSMELETIVTLQPFGGSLSATTLRHANVRRIELEVRNSDIDFGSVEAWEPRYLE